MSLLLWDLLSKHSPLLRDDDLFMWIKINAENDSPSINTIPHGTIFIYILWHLWTSRNHKVFQAATFSHHLVFELASFKAVEFHFLSSSSYLPSTKLVINISWKLPPLGWFKLNIDGSCLGNCRNSGSISVGGLIRDHCGNWVLGFSAFLGQGSSFTVELWALHVALRTTLDHNCINLIV